MAELTRLQSRFDDAAETSGQRGTLSDLIKERQLHKVASDESFWTGLEGLALSAGEAASATDRLLTVTALQHAAAAAPSLKLRIEALLKKNVAGLLSSSHELPDCRDRMYAAKSWRVVPKAWCLDDPATAVAREKSGEAVRKECIEGLFELADRIDQAIAALRKAALLLTFETKKPGDRLGRRLNRILAASTEVISQSHKPVGENAGREVSRL